MKTTGLPELVSREKVGRARAGLPAEDVLRDASEVFKALGNSTRIAIIHALAHDDLSVGDLARALDLSLPVASQHLGVLRRLKLVAGRDEGRLTFYRVIDDLVGHLVHDCLAHVAPEHTHGAKRSKRG